MYNTTESIESFDDDVLKNVTIVNPIEFLTKEENEFIIKEAMKRAKEVNDPTKWISWEESDRLIAKEIFDEDI